MDENIGVFLTYSCIALVLLWILSKLADQYLARQEKKLRQHEQHLLLQQIIEDTFWDAWIDNEARIATEIFSHKNTVSYTVIPPRSYNIFHYSAKYAKNQMSAYVFKRFEELRAGAGRNLILS